MRCKVLAVVKPKIIDFLPKMWLMHFCILQFEVGLAHSTDNHGSSVPVAGTESNDE
jgi:hypothetical protein